MTKIEEISKRIIEAKKSGNKFESDTLIMVKAELQNNLKDKSPKKDDEVLKSYVKRLSKSLEAFKGTDRYDNLVKEYDLVKKLLPEEMSEEEIRKEVIQFIKDNPEEKHIGKVIGSLKSKLKNADGGLLSKIIRENLAL